MTGVGPPVMDRLRADWKLSGIQGIACIVAGLAGFGCPLPDSKAVRYYTGLIGKGQEFHQFAEVTPVRFDYNERYPVDLPPLVDQKGA